MVTTIKIKEDTQEKKNEKRYKKLLGEKEHYISLDKI